MTPVTVVTPGARLVRVLACATAVALAATALLTALPSAARADDIGTRQRKVEAALKAATADLDQASATTVQAANALSVVQGRLAVAQQKLASARGQLAGAQAIADVARKNADAARTALQGAQSRETQAAAATSTQQVSIDALARQRYESGPSESISTLIGAGGAASSYLERSGLLEMVARGRDARLVALRDARAQLAADRAVVSDRTVALVAQEHATQAAVARVSQLVNQAASAQQDLRRLAVDRNNVLTQAEKGLAQDRTRVGRLQQESTDIGVLIRQREQAAAAALHLQQVQQQLAAARQQAAARAPAPAPAPAAPAPPPTGGVGRGGLIYPVDGPITSGFGYRLDPVTGQYALHAGVDFGVSVGTPIRAAKAGTVIYAGQETGYGNYTCIDHGGGFSTCYAHQSVINVSVGQSVGQGDVIGLSGNTGYSTGPHLHFETRVNGNPVDPMQYY
ncbi:MAG TPA: peptidoglycan DD-metalloendopeptidase family protein [Mycobacteriales bacterium]|nr:peptidoglycan DD-metalloendopeptidase family protein [Mycobacteriales bacterium]